MERLQVVSTVPSPTRKTPDGLFIPSPPVGPYEAGWYDGRRRAEEEITMLRTALADAEGRAADAEADLAALMSVFDKQGWMATIGTAVLAVMALIGWAAWWTGCAV